MNTKEEYIKKYGEAAYNALEKTRAATRAWQEVNPDKVRRASHEGSRKAGKYYKRSQMYKSKGLQGARHKIRIKHNAMWRQYKRFVAPHSQLHHNWRPQSALYDGLALVEADQHMHGFIDVIQILEGEITVFTEEELRERGDL